MTDKYQLIIQRTKHGENEPEDLFRYTVEVVYGETITETDRATDHKVAMETLINMLLNTFGKKIQDAKEEAAEWRKL